MELKYKTSLISIPVLQIFNIVSLFLTVPEEGQPSLGSDAETVQPPDQPGLGNPTQTQVSLNWHS